MIFSSTSAGHNKPKLSQLRLGWPVFLSSRLITRSEFTLLTYWQQSLAPSSSPGRIRCSTPSTCFTYHPSSPPPPLVCPGAGDTRRTVRRILIRPVLELGVEVEGQNYIQGPILHPTPRSVLGIKNIPNVLVLIS